MVEDLCAPVSASPRDVSVARHQFFDHLLLRGLCDDDSDTALLLMSELVTNAILHGDPPVELRVCGDDASLHVEVRDGRLDAAQLRPANDAALYRLGGRGLQLVDALATRWGADIDGSAKAVWFEIDLR